MNSRDLSNCNNFYRILTHMDKFGDVDKGIYVIWWNLMINEFSEM